MIVPVAIASVGCVHSDLPQPVQRIETAAESAYDHALDADHKSAAKDAEAVEKAWVAYRPHAERDGAPSETLAAVDAAVEELGNTARSSKDPVTIARAANGVCISMCPIHSRYAAAPAQGVEDLDALGREVALDGHARDFDRASESIARLEAKWKSVRPQITSIGASLTAKKYDQTLDRMKSALTARDPESITKSARDSLEVVEIMQTVIADTR